MSQVRPIVVAELPEVLVAQEAQRFLLEVMPSFEHDRPRVVFDFSNVYQVDRAGVAMLLNGIEEALMRNGDLKLAAVPSHIIALLEATGVDDLFEIFETAAEAVDSFHRIPGYEVPWHATPYPQNFSLAAGDD